MTMTSMHSKQSSGSEMEPQIKKRRPRAKESFEEPPLFEEICTYITYGVLAVVGYVSDFLRFVGVKEGPRLKNDNFKMNRDYDMFYFRNIFRRAQDCFERPVASTPGPYIDIWDRVSHDNNWTFELKSSSTRCLNLGSYNYLGFAQSSGPCAEASQEATHQYGAGSCSARKDLGTLSIHKELEHLVAEFVGKPAAMVFGMGFATNSTNIPALMGKGSLIISDQLNHTSLILGCRLSGSLIRTFKHNDMEGLEKVLRTAIIQGRPRTRKPWTKIMIVAEGVYSMEGSLANLPKIVELKKKYKAYLYLDEAHSIGAMGETGRGVAEYWGVDPADIDIMMGTFTKSFGASGGYIAATHEIVSHIRAYSHATTYATGMPGPVAQQIISSMSIIMGKDGTDDGQKRILQLAENSRYFRTKLHEMGFIVYGNEDSPVVPVLTYNTTKTINFSRKMLERKIATVCVGYPATPLSEGRIRICLSAAHTREMLDYALKEISEVGDMFMMKCSKRKKMKTQT
ncbi:serine palmitoyltransferase 2-like [Halichondria panicea]|uniref:serine palmitoyltransferase 2-like n=1 Tax=Halichondria panicea TaxID=6063 RepID=UPI00312B70F7